MKDRLRQPGGALSGGQQQRLCIARSLAVRPDALLMDAPSSALAPTSTWPDRGGLQQPEDPGTEGYMNGRFG